MQQVALLHEINRQHRNYIFGWWNNTTVIMAHGMFGRGADVIRFDGVVTDLSDKPLDTPKSREISQLVKEFVMPPIYNRVGELIDTITTRYSFKPYYEKTHVSFSSLYTNLFIDIYLDIDPNNISVCLSKGDEKKQLLGWQHDDEAGWTKFVASVIELFGNTDLAKKHQQLVSQAKLMVELPKFFSRISKYLPIGVRIPIPEIEAMPELPGIKYVDDAKVITESSHKRDYVPANEVKFNETAALEWILTQTQRILEHEK